MSVIKQLLTIVRGGTRESAEAVIDANALRLVDQQIYECEQAIQQARRDLTALVAERIRSEREFEQVSTRLTQLEADASTALDHGHEDRALSLAQEIADFEQHREAERIALAALRKQEEQLQTLIRQAITDMKAQRREAALLRATDRGQRATRRIHHGQDNFVERFADIRSSTARLHDRQQAENDRLQASDEVEASLSGAAKPEDRNGQAAEAVLERLKNRRKAED